MHKIRKMIHQYHNLPESKQEEFWTVMEEYYDKLPDIDKKDMGYELAIIVHGDELTEEEAEHIVCKMRGHGKSGKCWTIDEVRTFAHSHGIDFAKTHYSLGDLYAIVHKEYYDHYEFIHSLTNDPSLVAKYSVKLALGVLNDESAPEHGKGKARKYFYFVV